MTNICVDDDCARPGKSYGRCPLHYYRAKKAGLLPRPLTRAERFWSKVEKTDGCWLWTSTTNENGYGRFSIKRRFVSAHRLAYEMTVGPIPDGLTIDHLCRVRSCVRPEHLEAVTLQENCLRRVPRVPA